MIYHVLAAGRDEAQMLALDAALGDEAAQRELDDRRRKAVVAAGGGLP